MDEQQTPSQSGVKKPVWWRVVLLGALALLLVAVLAAWAGYQTGIRQRQAYAATQITQQLAQQYQLAQADIQAGRYEFARQRLEFILEQDPSYTQAQDLLVQVLVVLNATATPTPAPTPTSVRPTPTPNTGGQQGLLEAAQAHLDEGDWSQALEVLDVLRKDYPDFQPVQVAGMYYTALRNRGVERILNQGDLAGGMFDLDQAELLGPLDVRARNVRDWARYYQTGASFWEIDWASATYYFSIVAPIAPNLHDQTGVTASQRYRQALVKYIDLLEESRNWCPMEEALSTYLDAFPDEELQPRLDKATEHCANATPTPKPPTPTP